ncbi:leukocyte receptor cluster member 9 isoform X5 [Chiloscyllium plagiosum]|uniref:leukocyte receptor cluster member 9 isoform X5 n=1 Tax=Chiloscyllium plagiosum TaxID=36176 RepID=UPI001CB88A65|nr:leukocyte receptor cluster member 9 isoform X5 [Chiloscyllium plagiosum]
MADGTRQEGHQPRGNSVSVPVCTFHLRGRCAFGDRCWNQHPALCAIEGTASGTEIPGTAREGEIPGTASGSELPGTAREGEIPHLDTMSGTEIPGTAREGEIPGTASGTEIPGTAREGEIPHLDTMSGTELPGTASGTEMPDTASGTEMTGTVSGTEVSGCPGGAEVPRQEGKKAPMRTAGMVISRIRWDPELRPADFTVGYHDRFLGTVEQPFELFTWGELVEAELGALAIPQHRIQYFKHRGRVVWDRAARLDHVFGSTGGRHTIRELLADDQDGVQDGRRNPDVNQATGDPG